MRNFKAGSFLFLSAFLVIFAEVAEAKAQSPITDLNNTFRENYANTRTEMARQYKPLIIASPFELSLIGSDESDNEQHAFSSPRYTNLKSVSHIPLALYVLLLPEEEKPLSDGKKRELDRLITLIRKVEVSLPDQGFTERQVANQRELIQMSLDFSRRTLASPRFDKRELTRFVKNTRPIIDFNVFDAATAQINWLHQVVKPWYDRLSRLEQRKLKVLILAPKEPRNGYLMMQYFSRLLGVEGEGMQIVYAENVFDKEAGLKVLGTFLLDTQIGQDFFNDSWRMHEDLLSNSSREYIQTLNFGN